MLQQVSDNEPPKLADIKRQLQNISHEIDEVTKSSNLQPVELSTILAAGHRVREAIAHVIAAETRAQ